MCKRRPPYGMAANRGLMPCETDPQEGDVQSQVSLIVDQSYADHHGYKLIPSYTGDGPTTWHSITERPGRPKPGAILDPQVSAENQSSVMYRPCEDPHGNKLAAQLDLEGDPNGKRTTDVSVFKKKPST